MTGILMVICVYLIYIFGIILRGYEDKEDKLRKELDEVYKELWHIQ